MYIPPYRGGEITRKRHPVLFRIGSYLYFTNRFKDGGDGNWNKTVSLRTAWSAAASLNISTWLQTGGAFIAEPGNRAISAVLMGIMCATGATQMKPSLKLLITA